MQTITDFIECPFGGDLEHYNDHGEAVLLVKLAVSWAENKELKDLLLRFLRLALPGVTKTLDDIYDRNSIRLKQGAYRGDLEGLTIEMLSDMICGVTFNTVVDVAWHPTHKHALIVLFDRTVTYSILPELQPTLEKMDGLPPILQVNMGGEPYGDLGATVIVGNMGGIGADAILALMTEAIETAMTYEIKAHPHGPR